LSPKSGCPLFDDPYLTFTLGEIKLLVIECEMSEEYFWSDCE
jgi:hypothetical protein